MTITKSQIAAALKPLGLTQVRLSGNEYYHHPRIAGKAYRDQGGSYRGIVAASHSPMDTTYKDAESTFNLIELAMEKLGLWRCQYACGMSFKIKETRRSTSYVTFSELTIPTYVGAMNLPDYKTTWVVLNYYTDLR